MINQLLGIFLVNVKSERYSWYVWRRIKLTEKIKKEIKNKFNIKENDDNNLIDDEPVIINMPENDEIDTSKKKVMKMKHVGKPDEKNLEFSNSYLCFKRFWIKYIKGKLIKIYF